MSYFTPMAKLFFSSAFFLFLNVITIAASPVSSSLIQLQAYNSGYYATASTSIQFVFANATYPRTSETFFLPDFSSSQINNGDIIDLGSFDGRVWTVLNGFVILSSSPPSLGQFTILKYNTSRGSPNKWRRYRIHSIWKCNMLFEFPTDNSMSKLLIISLDNQYLAFFCFIPTDIDSVSANSINGWICILEITTISLWHLYWWLLLESRDIYWNISFWCIIEPQIGTILFG